MTDDRRRHNDWTGREPTRPGPHVPRADAPDLSDPLGETHDDMHDRRSAPTPIEGIAIDAVNEAADRLERASKRGTLDMDMKAAELGALHGSEWARGVDADILALKAALAPNRWRSLAKRLIAGLGLGAVAAVLGLAARALIAHGSSSAMGQEQADAVKRHEIEIRQLQRQQAADDEAHGRRNGP